MLDFDLVGLAGMANDVYVGCTYYLHLQGLGKNSDIVLKYFARAQELIDILKELTSSKFSRYLFWGNSTEDIQKTLEWFKETVIPGILTGTASADEVRVLRSFADTVATKILFRTSAAKFEGGVY